ncbi:unnamed protein product [Aureobasidium pullulans]|uniref:Uncharacterized protein n=1 Tax=Aureobasidium pullulans TaxID=5580 RepID=A0A4S8X2D2_AURPU|nr:hypothetical protein D6D22_10085 [Aureobasidium pullulans]CAC9892740.1 unnamed protein product [Aureobasidium pullulans]
MSKAINSPTGRLLRNSRLFSLPPPLPAAPIASSTAGQILRTSDTATQPYPTHQAISSPASSRSRGDWGLKRPLPGRAIPKNTPHLRIKAIDTLEHITDFESAADHTQSLAKWQEMDIAITLPPNARSGIANNSHKLRPSAFNANYDNTTLRPHGFEQTRLTAQRALEERQRLSADPNVDQSTLLTRWKTQGPHLTTMTEEEFERYLLNRVRENKVEFRNFLEKVKIEKKRQREQTLMRDHSDPATFEIELQYRSRLDEYELDDWIKELRDNHDSLNSELAHLVRDFFDLPAFPMPKQAGQQSTSNLANELTRPKNDAGPPSTHPSAGLYYSMTTASINNHPIYGPQADREPVQARVLRTKAGNRGRDQKADVGMGGFVSSITPGNVPSARTAFKDTRPRNGPKNPLADLDLSLTGGNKVWLQPRSAYVDEAGRIRLDVAEASPQSVDIKLGNPVKEEQESFPVMSGRQNQRLDSGFVNARYGTALPDERLRQPRAAPFESEGVDSKSGLEQIEALARGQRK